MPLGWPQDASWYKLLADWGSLIGAAVAVLAACAAYAAIRRQTRATQREFDAQRAAQQATKVQNELVAATLVDAALEAFKADLDTVRNMFDPAAGNPNLDDKMIDVNRARWLREQIRLLISTQILPYLGHLKSDLVREYFLIAAISERLRESKVPTTYGDLVTLC
jgi:hypothetical protein